MRPSRPGAATFLSLTFLAALLVLAIAAPLIAPHGVNEVIGGNWSPPSAANWLGTDNVGRDLLSRLIWSTRTTLTIATLSTVLAFLIGGAVGFIAGTLRGWLDIGLNRVNDLAMAIPTLIAALVVLSVLPSRVEVLVAIMALLDATRVFRLARALALDVGATDYVEAARVRGEGLAWIILREILPNALPPLLAEFGVRLVFAVLFLSTLSFLGLGIQPPATDWGSLLKENKDGLLFGVWAALIPGAAIALLAIAVSNVTDWFQEWTTGAAGRGKHG
ncbi:ABC transporter permease [Ancylobacter lacus]|uniref:ABC transporter permease n=1 Tax=Ancylobacter lacus TaxID=2579970 RepID=UPI003CCE556E